MELSENTDGTTTKSDLKPLLYPTVTPLSGGKSSAYVAANYESDYYVFALVRIEDQNCRFPDEKLRKKVEDRIQKPFIATAEMDEIIYTMFDLEQYLGKRIHWVSGETFDWVIKNKGGWLPNKLHRYCTTNLKLDPMFYWAAEMDLLPHKTQFGFRAGEENRLVKMFERANDNGFLTYKATFEKHSDGRHKGKNKWEEVVWQKPSAPMIDDGVRKYDVNGFWEGKNVRFAPMNNCVACFHRNEPLLNKMSKARPPKFNWFSKQEIGREGKGTWRTGITYEEIKNANFTLDLGFDDFDECDSGYCGV